jgi:uncharacterized protein (TIGR00730 family)
MNVTVFGGANPKPGEAAYQTAIILGELLAKNGHTVITGGYTGTMEAVSRGAAENGAHVIGVTCGEIEHWRPTGANAWVKEEQKYSTLSDRMLAMMDGCEAAVALPGGIGTMAEIALLWNRMAIEAVEARPLILIGEEWHSVFQSFFQKLGGYIPERDHEKIKFAADPAEAVDMLKHHAGK